MYHLIDIIDHVAVFPRAAQMDLSVPVRRCLTFGGPLVQEGALMLIHNGLLRRTRHLYHVVVICLCHMISWISCVCRLLSLHARFIGKCSRGSSGRGVDQVVI